MLDLVDASSHMGPGIFSQKSIHFSAFEHLLNSKSKPQERAPAVSPQPAGAVAAEAVHRRQLLLLAPEAQVHLRLELMRGHVEPVAVRAGLRGGAVAAQRAHLLDGGHPVTPGRRVMGPE